MSEMGDKTQLLAFSLAARFKKPWTVISGIFAATVLNHALASTVGQIAANQVSTKTLAFILGVLFIGFGIWTLKPDTLDDDDKKATKWGAFASTFILFFLAEMGDKTQFATIALGARFHDAFSVTLGTTLGMLVTDGLAVFLGETFAERVSMNWMRRFAALLFFAFGIISLISAF